MKKLLSRVVSVVGGVAILAVVAFLIALSLGLVYVGVKTSNNNVSVHTQVCSTSDIQKYNDLVVTFPTSTEQTAKRVADFKLLSETITAESDYAKDPSCVFMVYASAVQNKDAESAQKHYDLLAALSEKGEYPKNTILDIVSLKSMEDRVKSLTNPEEGLNNPLGSG